MDRVVRTEAGAAGERGRELGALCAERIADTAAAYFEHFEAEGLAGPDEIAGWGEEALAATADWAPALAEEIEGIAAGAKLPLTTVAALNARTEVLARVSRRHRGECSVLAALDVESGRPIGVQTWDWHEEFAASWLIWELADAATGMRVQTLTEAGMLGKIGVNSAGVAVLINVLHHGDDGEGPIAVPVHVLIRRVLIESETIFDAVRLISSAPVSASSAITVIASEDGEDSALTAEVRSGAAPGYVLPSPEGILLHTNHFLSPAALAGDLEPVIGPDSLFRLDLLRRRSHGLESREADDLLAIFNSHLGSGGAICCHPEPGSGLGDRYATLATVVVDPAAGRMRVSDGGPCEIERHGWIEVSAK